MPRPTSRSQAHKRADTFVKSVMALDKATVDRLGDNDEALAKTVLALIDEARVTREAFYLLDEKTRYWPEFYSKRFWMLRRVRNVFGNSLFGHLESNEQRQRPSRRRA